MPRSTNTVMPLRRNWTPWCPWKKLLLQVTLTPLRSNLQITSLLTNLCIYILSFEVYCFSRRCCLITHPHTILTIALSTILTNPLHIHIPTFVIVLLSTMLLDNTPSHYTHHRIVHNTHKPSPHTHIYVCYFSDP